MADRRKINLCLLGFGSANRAFAELVVEKDSELSFVPNVVAIVTGRSGRFRGSSQKSVDLRDALKADKISNLPGAEASGPSESSAQESIRLIQELREQGLLDVVVEAIPTDHSTGEPALSITKAALSVGVSVVSANKAPVAIALSELRELADTNKCLYLHEAACMDGIPIFNMARHCLPHAKVIGFEGVLNSTTNVMLEQLEKDASLSFEAALKVAQDMGIAEADPSGDIDGWDAAVKCVCLARALGISESARLADVSPVDGIRGVDGQAVAKELPQRYKLVCRGKLDEQGKCSLSVCRELIDPSSPLHSVAGSSSCVTFYTDVLGPLTIVQSNPTIRDTGYGLFADLAEVVRNRSE